jgi:hypothetical protein
MVHSWARAIATVGEDGQAIGRHFITLASPCRKAEALVALAFRASLVPARATVVLLDRGCQVQARLRRGSGTQRGLLDNKGLQKRSIIKIV